MQSCRALPTRSFVAHCTCEFGVIATWAWAAGRVAWPWGLGLRPAAYRLHELLQVYTLLFLYCDVYCTVISLQIHARRHCVTKSYCRLTLSAQELKSVAHIWLDVGTRYSVATVPHQLLADDSKPYMIRVALITRALTFQNYIGFSIIRASRED